MPDTGHYNVTHIHPLKYASQPRFQLQNKSFGVSSALFPGQENMSQLFLNDFLLKRSKIWIARKCLFFFHQCKIHLYQQCNQWHIVKGKLFLRRPQCRHTVVQNHNMSPGKTSGSSRDQLSNQAAQTICNGYSMESASMTSSLETWWSWQRRSYLGA